MKLRTASLNLKFSLQVLIKKKCKKYCYYDFAICCFTSIYAVVGIIITTIFSCSTVLITQTRCIIPWQAKNYLLQDSTAHLLNNDHFLDVQARSNSSK